ncbi:MAG TPA: hypothetical protein VK492_19870 [Chitinophagaceae bacterium]|nr:hypothetical protein [Chitinophagaceae bacterium]
MSSRFFFVTLFSIIQLFLSAQDISGVWVGNYKPSFFSATPDKLVVEISIYNDSLITGVSHLYYKHQQYEHYKIYGVYNKKESLIYFSEDSTIAVKLGPMDDNCLGNYTMKLTSTGNLLQMTGRWQDNSIGMFPCPPSGVWLEKKVDKNIKQTNTVLKDKRLERRSDIQSLVEISSTEKDSILIELYDNGIVDNDSASIYLDDSLLLYKQFVSGKAVPFYISLDKHTSISKLKLVAENLGSIPPCTVLMLIITKMKRYEVNLSSNFNSNAVVEFFLKE